MTGVAGEEEIEDSMLDRMASPASKSFNESRLHHPCHLMSLGGSLRTKSGVNNISVNTT